MELSCNSESVHGSRLKVTVIDGDYKSFGWKVVNTKRRLSNFQSFTTETLNLKQFTSN